MFGFVVLPLTLRFTFLRKKDGPFEPFWQNHVFSTLSALCSVMQTNFTLSQEAFTTIVLMFLSCLCFFQKYSISLSYISLYSAYRNSDPFLKNSTYHQPKMLMLKKACNIYLPRYSPGFSVSCLLSVRTVPFKIFLMS